MQEISSPAESLLVFDCFWEREGQVSSINWQLIVNHNTEKPSYPGAVNKHKLASIGLGCVWQKEHEVGYIRSWGCSWKSTCRGMNIFRICSVKLSKIMKIKIFYFGINMYIHKFVFLSPIVVNLIIHWR